MSYCYWNTSLCIIFYNSSVLGKSNKFKNKIAKFIFTHKNQDELNKIM